MEGMQLEELRADYASVAPAGARLIACLLEQLGELIDKNQIALGMPLEARVKAIDSLQEKVQRKTLVLNSVSDLDDLIGIRAILLFKDDLKRVGQIIKNNLDVMSYEDTSTRLNETQFGYQSDHFIVRIRPEWEKIPTYSGLTALKAEIQVRTMSQHIWAAASHKLQYKQEENIPQPLRRSIHRISALLETVDLELVRLNRERGEYISSINSTNPDVILDVDVVAKVLADCWPPKNLCPDDEDYDNLVSELRHFRITTAHDLRSFIDEYRDDVLRYESEVLVRLAKRNELSESQRAMFAGGYYFTQVALTRVALRRKFGDDEVQSIVVCGGGHKRAAVRKTRSKRPH